MRVYPLRAPRSPLQRRGRGRALFRRVFERLPVRRRLSEQVTGEEVEALVLAVGAAVSVIHAGDDEQIEVLVVLVQLIHDLHR